MAFSFEYDPVTKKFGMSVGTPPEDFTDIGATRDPFGDFKSMSPAVGIPGGSGTSGGKKGEGGFIAQLLDLIGIHDSVVKSPEGAKSGTQTKTKTQTSSQTKSSDNGSATSQSGKSGSKQPAEQVSSLLDSFDKAFGTSNRFPPLTLGPTPGMIIPIDPDIGFK